MHRSCGAPALLQMADSKSFVEQVDVEMLQQDSRMLGAMAFNVKYENLCAHRHGGWISVSTGMVDTAWTGMVDGSWDFAGVHPGNRSNGEQGLAIVQAERQAEAEAPLVGEQGGAIVPDPAPKATAAAKRTSKKKPGRSGTSQKILSDRRLAALANSSTATAAAEAATKRAEAAAKAAEDRAESAARDAKFEAAAHDMSIRAARAQTAAALADAAVANGRAGAANDRAYMSNRDLERLRHRMCASCKLRLFD